MQRNVQVDAAYGKDHDFVFSDSECKWLKHTLYMFGDE